MPSYTLDELIEMLVPQARRDKELINKCIHGLETYAAQRAQEDPASPKIAEMRGLIETLVCYWGLENAEDGGKPLEDYMLSFDNLMEDIKAGATVSASQYEKANTIDGLFRYGTEMESAQGSDAVFDILSVKKLMNEIAAFWEFEPKTVDNLTRQLDDAVQRLAGSQSERDMDFKNECITGLGLYAAEKVRDNYFASEPDDMRKLIENLVNYWGLEQGEKTLDDYLDTFDEQIWNAKHRKEVPWISSEYKVGALYGAYRYGEEMAAARGSEAMSDILDMRDLIRNIAMHWEFYPYDIVDDLAEQLRAEVRSMLADVTLPGQPATGENVRYQIMQAILFSNDRGFVLAHNPDAASPFVTWTFTDRNGERGYDVGHYFGTDERARLDYISRVTSYIEAYKVTEKPIPAERLAVSADAPSEAAPVPSNIPVEILSKDQPVVTVTFSEHDQLRGIDKMPLYMANTLFFEADERQSAAYFAALHSDHPIAPYLKTDFRIDFIINGKPDSYSGRYDVGNGDQTLIEHIQGHAEYYREDEDHQAYLERKGEKEAANAQYDTILAELVPFFEKHCELSRTEAAALSELMGIHEAAEGNPSDSAKGRIEYLETVVENVWRSRADLNGTDSKPLLELPRAATEVSADKSGCDDKTSVLDRIKASRSAPQQPHKPKTERDKKSHGTEL